MRKFTIYGFTIYYFLRIAKIILAFMHYGIHAGFIVIEELCY